HVEGPHGAGVRHIDGDHDRNAQCNPQHGERRQPWVLQEIAKGGAQRDRSAHPSGCDGPTSAGGAICLSSPSIISMTRSARRRRSRSCVATIIVLRSSRTSLSSRSITAAPVV